MFKIKKLLVSFFVLMIVLNLNGQKNLSKENIAKNYQPDAVFLHPEYLIFHENDSISTINFQVDLTEFKYKANADSSKFEANYQISYYIYPNYDGKEILDSGSVILFDNANFNKNNSQIGHINIKLFRGGLYVLKVVLTDLNSGENVSRIFELTKTNALSYQDFYLKAEDGLPIFLNSIEKLQNFRIVCNNHSINKLYIRKFNHIQTPSPPPMVGNPPAKRKISSDSSFIINCFDGVSDTLTINEQGFYFVSIDSLGNSGFTIFRFTKGFPLVTTPMEMIVAARYLCSGPEFKQMVNSKDKKKAIDDFWLKIAGNEARAKNQIAIYYNRVQNANKLFTSMQEGWMTDRGMIYIVYGPPETVYKSYDLETWIYGGANKNLSLKFNFIKQDNPASNNDYLLDRNQTYSGSWNSALEIWRR